MAIILSCDPGCPNFGISVLDYTDGKVTLLRNGIVKNPLRDLRANFTEQLEVLIDEVKTYWLQGKPPDGIICERFQSRGLKGDLIEKVTAMITALHFAFPHARFRLITAATWKNAYRRANETELDRVYKVAKVTPHQMDATLIGLYGVWLISCKPAFVVNLTIILPIVESVSVDRLINRKETEL